MGQVRARSPDKQGSFYSGRGREGVGIVVKNRFRNQIHQVHIADQPLTSCVLLDKLLNLHQPHFFICKVGIIIAPIKKNNNNSTDSTYLTSWGCHEG